MEINIIRNNMDQFARYRMPRIKLTAEGKLTNTRTVLLNLPEIAKSLNRSPLMLIKYICNEKGTNYNLKNQKYSIKGKYSEDQLQDMIYEFIDTYVLCVECNNPETFFVHNKVNCMKCFACGSCNAIVEKNRYNLVDKEISEFPNEKSHYDSEEVKIEDAENLEDFLCKNQLTKEQGLIVIVTKLNIDRLILLKDKIDGSETELLINIIKDKCVDNQKWEMINEYFDFITKNEIFDKDDCHKLFLSKSKKLTKENNAKIKKALKAHNIDQK